MKFLCSFVCTSVAPLWLDIRPPDKWDPVQKIGQVLDRFWTGFGLVLTGFDRFWAGFGQVQKKHDFGQVSDRFWTGF